MKNDNNRVKILKIISDVFLYSYMILLVVEEFICGFNINKNVAIKMCYILIIISILDCIINIIIKSSRKNILICIAFIIIAIVSTAATRWAIFI